MSQANSMSAQEKKGIGARKKSQTKIFQCHKVNQCEASHSHNKGVYKKRVMFLRKKKDTVYKLLKCLIESPRVFTHL
jgi:hypothetical protein